MAGGGGIGGHRPRVFGLNNLPPMTKTELENKHIAELHTLAAEAGVERYRMLPRAELIAKLSGDDSGSAGQAAPSRERSSARQSSAGGGGEQRERPPRRRRRRSGASADSEGESRGSAPRAPRPAPDPASPRANAPAARRRTRTRGRGRTRVFVTPQTPSSPPLRSPWQAGGGHPPGPAAAARGRPPGVALR